MKSSSENGFNHHNSNNIFRSKSPAYSGGMLFDLSVYIYDNYTSLISTFRMVTGSIPVVRYLRAYSSVVERSIADSDTFCYHEYSLVPYLILVIFNTFNYCI